MRALFQDLRGEGPAGEDPERLPLRRRLRASSSATRARPRAAGRRRWSRPAIAVDGEAGWGLGVLGSTAHGVRRGSSPSSTTWPAVVAEALQEHALGEAATATTSKDDRPRPVDDGASGRGGGSRASRTSVAAVRREAADARGSSSCRTRAEFENYRDAAWSDEREQASQEEAAPGLKGLIPRIDNLDARWPRPRTRRVRRGDPSSIRTRGSPRRGGGANHLRQGVELTRASC